MTRQRAALELLCLRTAEVGRMCGFGLLRDEPHGAWMRQMLLGREDMTLLAHRGSCKTTCLSLVIAVLLITRPELNMLFLRKTDDDVTQVLRQVKGILLSPAMRTLSAQLWGAPVTPLRAAAGSLTASCHHSPRGAEQLIGQGIGGSLTGKHADIIITDDIVNLQDRLSLPERQRTRSIYRELQNIRNPGGRIINAGTPWHPDDAIALMPGVIRCDCYASGLLTPAQLDRLRAAMPPSLFAANYELRHIASEDALVQTPPVMTDDEALLWGGIAHIDAAYGGGDGTALTLACRRADGDTVLLGRLWQAPVDTLTGQIAALCRRYGAAPVWCETNGDRGYLARELRRLGLPVRTYAERMPKVMKIGTYLRREWPRLRFLRDTDPAYLRQILDYTEQAAHDDAPDSAACALRILERQKQMEE